MLDTIQAVIFDMDGTLIDSMWIWRNIDIEYLGRFQIPLPEDLQGQIEGMSFSETAAYVKERFSISHSVDKIKQDWNQMAWDKYENEVPVKDGVIPFLKYLKERGVKMGVATSNSVELAKMVLEKRGLAPYFDAIHTSCEVAHGKPYPDIYEFVAEKLGATPEHCLVFEDVIQGIMAGKSANMKVCAVYDSYSEAQDEEKKRLADYYINSFEELKPLMQSGR
ncbi:HAD family hydrolase [[Clostridium] polysaccharolyticum]|uniref:Haloacid dehalogenase superfamily, subfamily IA, variant 3 with third motif having DD or ED/haloacid dehalogenase superfamily, subfamily IA, variant 1 with third motif having Dx(3-4)D or Dx(3-4)E n=1 Tax=[Clostridium] polysaccharolyticum TaxID=29364 RepID=A0A1I0AXJ6_9FIRM|nr:HAD family phosphatase [[Clostridium] polysaccharolyticum]SES99108.1 haloacid dehalogenase superfamily, subfamily IA, variant 3 with third motif having DD or ED/haloacid dehalogenase superfamily, subfamily IA, variant 1 with third motif having Dx(3-4)D or Dx(3-4)E [[Clostridium] polysaccharolyticum]